MACNNVSYLRKWLGGMLALIAALRRATSTWCLAVEEV